MQVYIVIFLVVVSGAIEPTNVATSLEKQTVKISPGIFTPTNSLDDDPKYIRQDGISANSPEYRDVQRNDLRNNFLLMNFESISNLAIVNGSYTDVSFSIGYIAFDATGSTSFPPFSGSKVAYSNEVKNNITFTKPVERFLARFSIDVGYFINVNAYDSDWNLVETEQIYPYAKNQEIKLFTAGKSFSNIRVSGPSGFETHWTIDAIEVIFKNRNLIDFDNLDNSSPVPSYGLITFPEPSYLLASDSLEGPTSGKLGINIPFEQLVTFMFPVSYIQFFVYSTDEINVIFLNENSKVNTVSIPNKSPFELVIFRGTVDSFMIVTSGKAELIVDDIYFEIEKDLEPQYSTNINVDGLNLDPANPKVDTLEIQATVNFSEVIFEKLEVLFNVFSGEEGNWSLITSYSEATWISGNGTYNSSIFRHSIEVDGNYTVFYQISFSDDFQISGQSDVFNSHAFGAPYFKLNTKEQDLNVFDFDNDGYSDSLSIDLNMSYFNAVNSNISIYATLGRNSAVTEVKARTRDYNFPHSYSVKTIFRQFRGGGILVNDSYTRTVNGNGIYSETFEYFNDWLIQGSTYFAYFFFVVDGQEIGRLTYTVQLFRRVLSNISIIDQILFYDSDEDGVFDSFNITVDLNFSKSYTQFYYGISVFMSESQARIKPIPVATFGIYEYLNGTGQIQRTFSFQASKTSTYKVSIRAAVPERSATRTLNLSTGWLYFETPLSFWLNGVPLLLDGVGDDPPELNLPSNQNSVPFPIFGLIGMIFIVYWRKRYLYSS